MRTFKVHYKHDQTGEESTYFLGLAEHELRGSTVATEVKNFLLNETHCYNSLEDSNGERWHGTFTHSFVEVSRPSDEDILKDITRLQEVIEYELRSISKRREEIKQLQYSLTEPYYEI